MILHWFRRDLRLEDNPALAAACRESGGCVAAVFVLSDWRGAHPWTGPARQQALCGSLRALAVLTRSEFSSIPLAMQFVEQYRALGREERARDYLDRAFPPANLYWSTRAQLTKDPALQKECLDKAAVYKIIP